MAKTRGGADLGRKLSAIAAKLKRAQKVRVGFLEGATYPNGTSVALVAAVNDFGSANMPPRPFFRNMVAEKSPEWPEAVREQLVSHENDARRALDLVGEGIAGQLRQAIVDFDGAPLSPRTVARKGFDKQLVDTGHMLNSVDHEVA